MECEKEIQQKKMREKKKDWIDLKELGKTEGRKVRGKK